MGNILKYQTNSIKRVLSGPMGVKKSYIAMFLAAKAFSENWLMLYVADAVKLDLFSDEESSKLIDDFATPFVEAIWNMLEQKYCKTLLVVDEHGILISNEYIPVPARLHILKPLMNLIYLSEQV
ncbi:16767_t:CDS:2 [Funneliformis mosseae]|uniref:16767_t:CDS:1 n=1 Tax=Funneliformis mosseae TaxID=27381 RepID=A0A9N8VAY1_FUNMO|nr:16767_t:CDS:2 [Funneliformis mosseae]